MLNIVRSLVKLSSVNKLLKSILFITNFHYLRILSIYHLTLIGIAFFVGMYFIQLIL